MAPPRSFPAPQVRREPPPTPLHQTEPLAADAAAAAGGRLRAAARWRDSRKPTRRSSSSSSRPPTEGAGQVALRDHLAENVKTDDVALDAVVYHDVSPTAGALIAEALLTRNHLDLVGFRDHAVQQLTRSSMASPSNMSRTMSKIFAAPRSVAFFSTSVFDDPIFLVLRQPVDDGGTHAGARRSTASGRTSGST